ANRHGTARCYGSCGSHRNGRVGKRRNESRNGVGETNLSFLNQHEDGKRRDRFGERCEWKDCVLRQRLPRIDVDDAARLEVNDAAVLRDQRDGSRNLAGSNTPIDHLADPRQAIAGERAVGPLSSLGWNRRTGQHGHAETACEYRRDAPRARLCQIKFSAARYSAKGIVTTMRSAMLCVMCPLPVVSSIRLMLPASIG